MAEAFHLAVAYGAVCRAGAGLSGEAGQVLANGVGPRQGEGVERQLKARDEAWGH